MSIKQLQKAIRQNEGYILSDGTLNLQHLLPKAYDLIITYNMQSKAVKDILQGIKEVFKDEDPTFIKQYYSKIELDNNNSETMEQAEYLWNEDIFNYFNNISPNKYYFGCSEGDGACIGWFKYDENNMY
jgi:hypothetical protein